MLQKKKHQMNGVSLLTQYITVAKVSKSLGLLDTYSDLIKLCSAPDWKRYTNIPALSLDLKGNLYLL